MLIPTKLRVPSALLFVCLSVLLLCFSLDLIPHLSTTQAPLLPVRQEADIEAIEESANRGVWRLETLSHQYGHVVEALWDEINLSTNKLGVLAKLDFSEIHLPGWKMTSSLPHDISFFGTNSMGETLDHAGWAALLGRYAGGGWRLSETEFRHVAFSYSASAGQAFSRFYFLAHLTNSQLMDRAQIEGHFSVTWSPSQGESNEVRIQRIDTSELSLKTRAGPAPFALVYEQSIAPLRNAHSVDPLLMHDLDGDGLPEIILAGKNMVLHRLDDGSFRESQLCDHPPGPIYSAVLDDFDGDGLVDLLCLKAEGLVLFKGAPGGKFPNLELLVWPAPPEFVYPMVMTSGDIDGDGDSDLFIGQYKLPYEDGSVPTPFHNSNDGYPSFLLVNNGHAEFTDSTHASGLEAKRHRRVYSSSFVDWDGDGHLDLVVVSDFCGVDLFLGNGRGQFTEVTADKIDEPHAFGMAHSFSDFNSDGILDLFVSGMTSPTVDRLESASLHRSHGAGEEFRAAMAAGNRLYLGQPDHSLRQNLLSSSAARTGWTWGCAAFDVDNDGFTDVYVANGMETKSRTKDYEGDWWLHDLYVTPSTNDQSADEYFKKKFLRNRQTGWSYGGNEKNRLLLNLFGSSFTEVGHLFGVALPDDSRNVAAEDLDGDGAVDLIVISGAPLPSPNHILRIFRNQLSGSMNWVGVRLGRRANSQMMGTKITCVAGNLKQVKVLINGDGYRTQNSCTVHFGLGTNRADQIVIEWPNGDTTKIDHPIPRTYQKVNAPTTAAKR